MQVTKSGTGAGEVRSSPSGVSCGTDCSEQFQPGMQVTLTAMPDDTSRFTGWTGADCSGTTCTVTMDQATNVGAAFEPVATPGTYQESSPLVKFTGTWTTAPANTKDFGGRVRLATKAPGKATLTFRGTGVRWVTRKARTDGISNVYLDGRLVVRVDGYSSTTQYRATAFSSATLTYGEHTVTIAYSGRKRAAATNDDIVLDAFVVR